ncbi:hypothetical protein KCV07_g149, partial [Aureobasidium melanogenum]
MILEARRKSPCGRLQRRFLRLVLNIFNIPQESQQIRQWSDIVVQSLVPDKDSGRPLLLFSEKEKRMDADMSSSSLPLTSSCRASTLSGKPTVTPPACPKKEAILVDSEALVESVCNDSMHFRMFVISLFDDRMQLLRKDITVMYLPVQKIHRVHDMQFAVFYDDHLLANSQSRVASKQASGLDRTPYHHHQPTREQYGVYQGSQYVELNDQGRDHLEIASDHSSFPVGRDGESGDGATLDGFCTLSDDALKSLVIIKDQDQTFGCANGDGGRDGQTNGGTKSCPSYHFPRGIWGIGNITATLRQDNLRGEGGLARVWGQEGRRGSARRRRGRCESRAEASLEGLQGTRRGSRSVGRGTRIQTRAADGDRGRLGRAGEVGSLWTKVGDIVDMVNVLFTKFILEGANGLVWEGHGAAGTAHGLVSRQKRVLMVLIGVLVVWEVEGAIGVMAIQRAMAGRGAH